MSYAKAKPRLVRTRALQFQRGEGQLTVSPKPYCSANRKLATQSGVAEEPSVTARYTNPSADSAVNAARELARWPYLSDTGPQTGPNSPAISEMKPERKEASAWLWPNFVA